MTQQTHLILDTQTYLGISHES